jgi:hypothetical protein
MVQLDKLTKGQKIQIRKENRFIDLDKFSTQQLYLTSLYINMTPINHH